MIPPESREERRCRFEPEALTWMRALYGFAVSSLPSLVSDMSVPELLALAREKAMA